MYDSTAITMICFCCGSSTLKLETVLWQELIDQWRISSYEVDYINRQQGLFCLNCKSNLRSMTLARAIMKCFSYEGYFKDFVKQNQLQKLRILEINEAGSLTKYLSQLSGHTLATYPQIDMMCLPFLDNSFDLVVHSDTLEHINNPVKALSECYRVLKPKGICSFTVPIIIDRLTRSREGLPPSYHGSPKQKKADFLVHTEYGSDAWKQVIEAGFDECRIYSLEYPSAQAMVGVKTVTQSSSKQTGVFQKMGMEFTGERYVPSLNGRIKYEHLHRYGLSLKFVKDKAVLDIASGEGYGSALLAKVASSVVGVDIDSECVEYARQKYGDTSNLNFLVGSCSSVPLPNRSIDVVTSFETIEHHDQHEQMMGEIKRVLKPGGLLLISSPNRLTYLAETKDSNPFHVKELYYEELVNLLERYFKYVQIYGQRLAIGSFIFPLSEAEETVYTGYQSSGDDQIEQKVCSLRTPIYFVAICSDEAANVQKAIDSVYIDSTDDLLKAWEESWHQILTEVLRQSQAKPQATQAEQEESLIRSYPARIIEHYQKNTSDQSALSNLRQVRKQIADFWLSTVEEQLETVYLGEIGKGHQILINSGIKDEPLLHEEQIFLGELVNQISREFERSKAIQYLLAAMLYYRADQLSLQHDLTRIPPWFINDYLKFVFNSPHFQELGEADSYYRYMQQWIDYLHASILSNPNSSFWQNIAVQFLQVANFIPIYFNEANLKDIYVKRAEILEYVIKLDGYEVDYEFAPRDSKRKKIRLGILASHFTPAAETFASLPIYEYLSREFEVILYSLSQTGHQLEQYCQSCANSFKLLPQNLKEQVNCIRADDLDLLFIATNVTAGTNQICLLSLHRLARVQVTSIASIVTTGIRNVDYYLSGKLTDQSSEAEHHYREQLLRLEGSAHCFSYGSEQNTATVTVDRKKLGISEESVVFVSVANMFKITPELSHTWAKIIASVPNSVLLLFPFGPNWSNSYPKKNFLNNISKIFSQYGLEQSRCINLDPVPVPNRDDIKQYLKLSDIYLDSYPFSGTTSLIEPLEVGLPIVARQGTYLRSAMGAALLQEIGRHDLVANSEESYIQLAIALGTEPELRKQKSDQIERKMQGNPKFLDSRSYSAQVGALFQELLRKHQADALGKELKLRDINLIIFPDWSQSEESISLALASVIRAIATHPDKNHITLLIDTSNIANEDAELTLSSIVMNLMMEEDLDVTEGPEISLIDQLSEMEWQALSSRIHARIVWENETPQAIAYSGVNNLPIIELNHFSSKRVVQLNNGSWSLESTFSN